MEIPGFSRGSYRHGDITIAYTVGGAGPPVLLLHGYPQTHALWARVAPVLAAQFTVVCADLRGYGDSSKPRCLPDASNYAFRAFAQDQHALMQHLGHARYHVIGHDRGGRTAHRLALDQPQAVRTLTVMDIVPTHAMFLETNHRIAAAYWHWYFLQQPEPFPETIIGRDPDHFYETCLFGWGGATAVDFDPEMLAAYRRAWRDPGMIHGSCSDYRAAAGIDLAHDSADIACKVGCPTLVLYGERGVIARLYDVPAEWRRRCSDVESATLPGGHFFIDQHPAPTAQRLLDFLGRHPDA